MRFGWYYITVVCPRACGACCDLLRSRESCNEPLNDSLQWLSHSLGPKGAFRAYSLLASGLRRPLTRRMIRTAWAHIGVVHTSARLDAPRGPRSTHQRRIRATGHESVVRVRRTT